MNESTALSIVESVDTNAMSQSLAKINEFQKLVRSQLTADVDYGVIPGTSKPTLLKPGCEKLIMLMGLTSEFAILDSTRDFEEGFFQYQVRCQLFKNGALITEGLGSANTREGKYVKQDSYTIDNTILKMAKKRAMVDATLVVASLSQIFTQDIEDLDLKGNAPKAPIPTGDMTLEQAENITLEFGKHQGKKLGKVESGYIKWLAENAREEHIKLACNIILQAEDEDETATIVDDVDDYPYDDSDAPPLDDYPE